MQFHPTAVAVPGELDGFLVTEAVRGDGALLLTDEGERFVDELAPRDEVTLAMQSLMSAGRHAFLDLRPVDMRAFPNIVERLAGAGIDPERDLVPVAPAALHDRRCGDGRARTLDVGRPLRGRRMRVHRRSRSQPARLEFALGVLRLRQARSLGAVEETVPTPSGPPPVADPPGRPGEETRAPWHDAGPVRDAAGLTRLAADPYRSPG